VERGNSTVAGNDLVLVMHRLILFLALASAGIVGCGSDSAAPTRSYTVDLQMVDDSDQYDYVAVGEVPTFETGDQVTFAVENAGTLNHDLQVVGPDGSAVATAAAVAPGATLTLTVDLDEPGIYQLNCLVDNHLTEHYMQTLIEVVDT
jgi:uncharacterized cupredoxin-like copper-binding protein